MEGYTRTAVERAMKVHEVILKARAGKITWLQAAEVLGIHPRTMRRWKRKMDQHGVHSLVDQRSRIPSPRRVPGAEIDRILELYRERYSGFNVRHFHDVVRRDHEVRRSYTLVKRVLQGAGLVRKQRLRGKHRRRRERCACLGEMLHLDGSRHRWLAADLRMHTLITVVDDATGRLLHARLWPSESRLAVMSALHDVFVEHGLPQRLYTDRASWAAYTPRAGGRADPRARTQLQRALQELGIEHIRAYAPQARGRGERVNRTLQGRVVNEMRVRGITTPDAANLFLHQYRAEYDQRFALPPADPASGFVAIGPHVDLDRYLCVRVTRRVGQDNTVVLGKAVLQIPRQPGRRSCQNMQVTVRQHLDGRFSIDAGLRRLAVYDARGRLLENNSRASNPTDRRTGAILGSRFQRAARQHRSTTKRTDQLSKTSGQITC